MSTSFEAQGLIHSIDQTREYGQNGFTKREFVIKLTGEGEKAEYPNYVALEFLKDKCALLDQFQIGDEVKVTFNLSGRLWTPPGKPEKCFTSLQAWRIESASANAGANEYGQPMPNYEEPNFGGNSFDEDVPFWWIVGRGL